MENEKIVVGLDNGTTKICVIVGRKNEYGKLEVLGMGKAESEGVIKGIVTNIDKTVFAITKAIKEASDMSGIDIGVVNVGIAGQHIRSSIHHGSITRLSNEDEINIEDPVGMSGMKLEADFHIITAQTSAINNINKCVRRSRMEIDDLILEPLA